LADDGSSDQTVNQILALNDPKVKLVKLRKNYGQSSAMSAGIDYAAGEYIVTMDGDLQNDPSDIPMMLEEIEKGDWGLVAGIRANRKDGVFLRKIPSKIANYIIRSSTDIHIKDYGCTLKIFEADIAKELGLYGELHRFIPVLAHLQGAKITQVDVKHHARQFGESKYGINRTFKVMADLILMLFFKKYLQKPIHLFGIWGILLFAGGVCTNVWLLIDKLILGNDIWGRPLMILGVILLLGGIQLITIGLVMEMQMRTYYESQNKRPYNIKQVYLGAQKI
jgi:glycosyltransferase involved in cell wall biosynthesis